MIATTAGVLLFLNTDYVVLFLGAVSFIVGVLYSAGPVPISRTLFGEVFSGVFMGFLIPFISLYIHIYDQNILTISFLNYDLTISLKILEILSVFLCSVPAVTGIANIMLANNICDMEEDFDNSRHTLPLYIGKEKSLILFKMLYYISYIAVILACALKILPYVSLLFLLTFIPLRNNVRAFLLKQSKKETFALSIKNFVLMNVCLIFTLLIALGFELVLG